MRCLGLTFVLIYIFFRYVTAAVLQVQCDNTTNLGCLHSNQDAGPVFRLEPGTQYTEKMVFAESVSDAHSFFLVDRRGPDRTVLFSDGYARDQVNFRLLLKPGETLLSVRSIANDTDILTSSTAEFSTQTLSNGHPTANVTVVHYFEGSVGSVSYVVSAQTSKGRTFSAMGHYYLMGIVGASRSENGTTTILTGIEAAAITFESPLDLSEQWKDNIIEIPIVYQPPGPDFYPDIQLAKQPDPHVSNAATEGSSQSNTGAEGLPSNSQSDEHPGGHLGERADGDSDEDSDLEPSMSPSFEDPSIQSDIPNSKHKVSLKDIMSETRVEVGGHIVGSDSNLIAWDPTHCSTITEVRVNVDGSYNFENEACGIGFDKENGRLLIRVRPNQSGFANIVLTSPMLFVDGEISETSVHVVVQEAPHITPKLVLFEDKVLKLDYFGKEVFALQMRDTLAPPQAQNATDYIVDLPNGRYARASFHTSHLSSDVQDIIFETQRVGEEDMSIIKKLASSMKLRPMLTETSNKLRFKISKEQGAATGLKLAAGSLRSWFFGSGEDQAIDHSFPEESPMDDIEEMEEPAEEPFKEPAASTEPTDLDSDISYESHVFVQYSSSKPYEMAHNTDGRKLETEFAPATLAQATAAPLDTSREYVVVSLVLYKYAAHNFSEHKSSQLGRSIARQVEIASRVAKHSPEPMRMTTTNEMTGSIREGNETEAKAYLTRVQERPSSIVVTYRVAMLSQNGSQIATGLTIQENGIAEKIATDAMLPPGTIAVYDARMLPTLGENNYSGAGGGLPSLAGATAGVVIAAVIGLALIVTIPLIVLLFGFVASRRNTNSPASVAREDTSAFAAVRTSPREGPESTFIERDETHRRVADDV